jgi:hypothetical protein
MNIRWTDKIAFWAINHLLSYPGNHRFELDQFDAFSKKWSGCSIDDFYSFAGEPSNLEESAEQLRSLPLPSTEVLKFTSPVTSDNPENDHIWIELHLSNPIEKAPIFLIQHGWRSVSVRGYHRMCRELNTLGVNAGILHLPYHFSRKPRRSFNGELAISSNIVRSAHSLRQAVLEVRWLNRMLKLAGAPKVGLWGTSYGAWISAMAVTLDDSLDAALLLEPPVEIEELFWEAPLFSGLQRELNRLGISRKAVETFFHLVTPYRHPLKINPEHVLILGSQHDPIGHPDSLRKLQKSWPGTYCEIFPYGHISYKLHTSAVERFLSLLAPKLIMARGAHAEAVH